MTIRKIALKSKTRQNKTEKNKKMDYMTVKQEFEKNHAKIINKSFFIKFDDDKHIIMSKNKLITSYEHLSYTINVKDEIKQKNLLMLGSKIIISNNSQILVCIQMISFVPRQNIIYGKNLKWKKLKNLNIKKKN